MLGFIYLFFHLSAPFFDGSCLDKHESPPCFRPSVGLDEIQIEHVFYDLSRVICSQERHYLKEYPVTLGDTTLSVMIESYGSGKTFVHLHNNETTAKMAARAMIVLHGGTLISLNHTGGRDVTFKINHKEYVFDPNRIFTEKGISDTLDNLSQDRPRAHVEIRKLANQVLRLLPPGKIIAVHNNAKYSLHDYYHGNQYEKDADALSVNPNLLYRNFYLVTQHEDYQRLKAHHLNAVLQAQDPDDDGSLSVRLANRDYVNVEAGFGELSAQMEMLADA